VCVESEGGRRERDEAAHTMSKSSDVWLPSVDHKTW
jgi:hypothetical protein